MSKAFIEQIEGRDSHVSATRRHALKLTYALSVGLTSAVLGAEGTLAQNADHAGHVMAGPKSAQFQDLIDAALVCVNRGEVCLNHCAKQLGTGDTSLKDCIDTVAATLAMCGAVARLAAFDSPHVKELTKLCIDVCGDCEKECRKHEQHHVQCKNCADSCTAFIKEGKKVIGA